MDNAWMPEPRMPGSAFGLLLILLACVSVGLGLVLNEWTLRFLYADGRLVPDVIARIRTVQGGFGIVGLLLGFAGAALRSRPPAWRSLAENLALAAVLLCYLPVTVELVLALQYPGFYQVWDPFHLCHTSLALDDARLGHVLNAALDHSYRINSRGFRGAEFDATKPAGEARVVTVGDSITFGWEISEDDATYPGQLQALLDRRTPGVRRVRVINAGVPRYTSEQVVRLLRDDVLGLQPDLVVLCVGWNDLAFSYHRDWRPRISFTGHMRARYCSGFNPAILRAVRHWKGGEEEGEAEDGPPDKARAPHAGALEEFAANLDEIAALLRERGVGLLVLNLPSVLSRGPMTAAEQALASRFPEVENLALFEGVVDDFCARSRAACVLDVFPLAQQAKGRYFYDHCHPNREGNGVVAEKVYEAIERDPELATRLWGGAEAAPR